MRTDAIHLTRGQRALWYLNQLAPSSSAYNIGGAAWVDGAIDRTALGEAVGALGRRHPSLAMRFAIRDDEPVGLRDPAAVPRLILDHRPAADEEALVARAAAILDAAYDLRSGPLVRVALIAAPGHPHLLVLGAHHSISDFASLAVLLRDLEAFYRGALSGRPVDLPAPSFDPATLGDREEEDLAGPRAERAWRFWRDQLEEAPARLAIPSDRPGVHGTPRLAGASLRRALRDDLAAGVEAFARREGVNAFVVLAAAFQVLLHRFSGQPDVLLGTPATARDKHSADVVGYLVNPLTLRARLADDPTFATHVARTKRSFFGALRNRAVPYAVLAEELAPQGAEPHAPLFQAMFVRYGARRPAERILTAFTLGWGDAVEVGAWRLRPIAVPRSGAQLDLFLAVGEVDDGLVSELTYDTDRIDPVTAARLLDAYETLLAAALRDPRQPVSSIDLLGKANRETWLVAWQPPHAGGSPTTLDERFRMRAARQPDATALIDGDRSISYRALARAASCIALALRERGIGPGARVGIATPRSAEMVAGLFATLAVGAAYVPLDPSYPADRLRMILDDCDASLVLVQGTPPAALAELAVATLDLGALRPLAAETLGRELTSRSVLDGAAYVIYTSGSTGRPKGVAIAHRSADALVRWSEAAFDPAARRGVLAATSICFDLSVFEIFATLGLGGTVVLARDALALPGLPAARRVTLVNTVPSAAGALVAAGGLPASVTHVCLAGEPLPGHLVEALHASDPSVRVFNLYGPSEDTTYSTWAEIARGEAAPPIGRPIDGTRAYIVDRRLTPVPPGAIGEVVLAGSGVAQGYLRRPGLTAERFVPDPFAGQPGGRIYRTGDQARFRGDGELAFLGRADHQVKIRGFRIELGEIEAALRDVEGIDDALVMARDDGAGDQRLIAFVVGGAEASAAATVRRALGARLPAYMVPQHVERLAQLPLLPNGKIDRKRLGARPVSVDRVAGEAFVAPSTEVEEMLAAMWRDALGVERVGIYDDFFELGGHSLVAMRVLARIREAFGIELALRALLDQPTIAGVQQAIADQLMAEADEGTVAAVLAALDEPSTG